MNREQVIEKIKKLYSLSGNNPSVNEATAAALMAQRLMHKYHIEELDLAESAEELMELVESEFKTGTGHKWKYQLSHTIATNFRVKSYWLGREAVCFYGQTVDVTAAKQTYEFLYKLCISLSRKADYQERKRTGSCNGAGTAFALGFVNGVAEELGKQCTALMVITPKEVEDGYEKMCKEKGMKTMHNNCSYNLSQGKQFENGKYAGKSAVGQRALSAS